MIFPVLMDREKKIKRRCLYADRILIKSCVDYSIEELSVSWILRTWKNFLRWIQSRLPFYVNSSQFFVISSWKLGETLKQVRFGRENNAGSEMSEAIEFNMI